MRARLVREGPRRRLGVGVRRGARDVRRAGRGAGDATRDRVEVGGGIAARGDPAVDVEVGDAAAVRVVGQDEDVADRVGPAERAAGRGAASGRSDLALEEPEPDEVVATGIELVHAEVDDGVAGRVRIHARVGGREGVGDVVLVLNAPDLPQPVGRVVVVLRRAAREDVIPGVHRIGDELGRLGRRRPGVDFVPVVARHGSTADRVAVELEQALVVDGHGCRGQREGGVLQQDRQDEERRPGQRESLPGLRADKPEGSPRCHGVSLPVVTIGR